MEDQRLEMPFRFNDIVIMFDYADKKTIDIDYIIIDLAGCSKNCLLLFVDLLLDTEISILTHTWLAK